MTPRSLILIAFLLLAPVALTSVALADVAVVAAGGDPAPDGNGTFFDFDIPSMNASAQVAFMATLNQTTGGGNDNTGIFRGSNLPGNLTVIVRRGAPSPDGNGNFALFDSNSVPVINDSGEVAFIAGLTGTFGGGFDTTGLFRGDGTAGSLAQIVRSGQDLPGTGKIPNLRGGGVASPFAFNSMAEVALSLTGLGIFRTSGDAITPIVRSLQALPGGGIASSVFPAPALNDMGQVAFADSLNGIFRGDGSTIDAIARAGDPAPDGNGTFMLPFIAAPAINNSGAVAFSASLSGTSGSTMDNQGIFIRKGDTLTTIVRRGQTAPDGNGRFLDLSANVADVAINDGGQTAFVAILTATANGVTDKTGLFRGDGTTLTQIVRTGDKAPDGSTINSIGKPALNDAGQVAFLAGLAAAGGATTGQAILLYDDQRGMLQAVRSGNPLAGSIIAPAGNLIFEPSVSANGKKRSGLNQHGLVVFRFDLNDGRRGIAVADPFTMSATSTPTASPTPTATHTPSGPTPCQGRRCVPTPSTAVPTSTVTPGGCVGDCDGSHDVAVNEIIQLVNFALGSSTDCSTCTSGIPASVPCPSEITVSIIIQAVNNALNACPAPTATPGSRKIFRLLASG